MWNAMETQPFILAELEDLSAIFAPLKTTSRIKYTTFTVSNNFLIFGATSGGLYVFKREPCVFLQLLPNKEGSVTQVAISSDEKLIAFSTVRGTVCALECSGSHGARHIVSSFEHQNSQVTALHWSSENDEVYIGDDAGKVSVLSVSLFAPKNMFQTPTSLLMQLDSKVVQLDLNSDMLLVSTLTRSYICDTNRELFRQIGHKLRDGEYGACIYSTDEALDLSLSKKSLHKGIQHHESFSSVGDKNISLDYSELKHLKLFCARPGSRIWEVSIEGSVLSTHHFKQALAVAPTNIIFQNLNNSSHLNNVNNYNLANGSCHTNDSYSEQSFNFQKLYTVVYNKFLFTFKSDGLYIFDPGKASVVLWNNEFQDITDAKCVNDIIYVWCGSGKMFALIVTPLERYLIRLYFRKKYLAVAKLCLDYSEYLTTRSHESGKLHLLADLDVKLREGCTLTPISETNDDNSQHSYQNIESLCARLKPLLELFSTNAQMRPLTNAQKLQSGIFVVGNNAHFCLSLDENLVQNGVKYNSLKLSRPTYLSGLNISKSRSLSASPDRNRKKGNCNETCGSRRGSTSSLPELLSENANRSNNQNTVEDKTLYNDGLMFSGPETMQALRDLSNTVSDKLTTSTKNFREKWHFIEDKMKFLGQENYDLNLFDVKTSDYESNSVSEDFESESIVAEGAVEYNNMIEKEKKCIHPEIDVTECLSLLNNHENNEVDIVKLFSSILSVLKLYNVKTDSNSNINEDVLSSNITDLWEDITFRSRFPFKYYFKKQNLEILKNVLLNGLKNGVVINWLLKYTSCVELDNNLPDFLIKNFTRESLKLDIKLSQFLKLFLCFLDENVIEEIKQLNLDCYFFTLCVILEYFEDNSSSSVADVVLKLDEINSQTKILNYLYRLIKENQCLRYSHKIDIIDVLYLILKHQYFLNASQKSNHLTDLQCGTLFLTYLDQLPDKEELILNIKQKFVLDYIKMSLVTLNTTASANIETKCTCGYPVPGLLTSVAVFSDIGCILLEKLWEDKSVECFELCGKIPYFWKYLISLRQSENVLSLLPLILQFGDFKELEYRLPELTAKLLEVCVRHLIGLKNSNCLNCGSKFKKLGCLSSSTISWSQFGMLCIKVIGPQETLNLYEKYSSDISSIELDQSFYQALTFSTIMEKHSKGLRKNVVDLLIGKTEKELSQIPVLSDKLKEELFSKKSNFECKKKETKDRIRRTEEESQFHHWGIKLDLKSPCLSCTLPLDSTVLINEGGLKIFKCKHSFHSVCLRKLDTICPICKK